jgi:hypothetical protein
VLADRPLSQSLSSNPIAGAFAQASATPKSMNELFSVLYFISAQDAVTQAMHFPPTTLSARNSEQTLQAAQLA